MIKKFAGAVATHLVAGMLLTGITSFGAELPKSYSNNLGNNELKVGYITDIQYSENPDSVWFDECTDIITFNIDGELYTTRDFAEDMYVDDCCLIIINTKGTENRKDDVILDYRCYWDYRNGEYVFEP